MKVMARIGGFKCKVKLLSGRIGRLQIVRALCLVVLVVGFFSPVSLHAQVTVSTNWHDYAVVGLNSISVSDSTVTGDIYAGRDLSATFNLNVTGNTYSGGNLSATWFTGSISGNVAANGSIAVNTVAGNAVYGTTFSGSVTGNKLQAANAVPTIALPPPTTFSPGTNNVSSTGSLTLSPGAYGNLAMSGFGDLNLSSGTYYFKSFTDIASGTIRLNLSGGPVRIYVANDLGVGDFTAMAVTGPAGSTTQSLASDVLWEVHGNAALPSNTFWTNFIGTVFAPYGNVSTNWEFNSMYGQILSAGPISLGGGTTIRAPSNLLSSASLLLKGTDTTIITGGTVNVPVSVSNIAASGTGAIGYSLNVVPFAGSAATMTGATPPSNSISPGTTQANTVAITSTQIGTNLLSLRAVDPTSSNDLETASFQLNVLNHAQPGTSATSPARVMLGSTANGTGTIFNSSGSNAGLYITSTGGLAGISVGDLLAAGNTRTVSAPVSTSVTGPVVSSAITVGVSDDPSLPGATALPSLSVAVAATVLDNRRVTSVPVDLGFVHVNTAVTGSLTLQTTGDDNHFTRITVNNAAADANHVSVSGSTSFRFGLDGLTSTKTIGGTITALGTVAGSFNLTTNAEAGVTGTQTLANVPVSYTMQSYSGKAAWNSATGTDWKIHTSWHDTQGTASGGAPGVTSATGDTATFGNAIGASAATITLNGTSPSLASLTFDNNLGGSYSILPGSGGSLNVAATAGSSAIVVNNGSHHIGAPITMTGSSAINVAPVNGSLSLDGLVTSNIGLTKTGLGTLSLSSSNSITGTVTVSAGTLVGSVAGLSNTIVNNAALTMEQPVDATFAGSMTGTGTFAKSGTGKLTLAGADTLASSGAIDARQGTLTMPFGAPRSTAPISVQSQGILEAAGSLPRALSGTGTVSAIGDLFIGRSTQSGQFNLGGAPGVGGVLNINSNAAVILSNDAIVLGTLTQLATGGSLTTLNGARLGNPTSLDVTKVLSSFGNVTINGDFTNNGIVNGPTGVGNWLSFTQDVHGAGSLTGNVAFLGSYSPGNSPAVVSSENLLLDNTSSLTMEIGGALPGQYDQLDVSGLATLEGSLNISLLGSYTLDPTKSYQLIQGATTGQFTQINNLPAGWAFDYSSGSLVSVPEPCAASLFVIGAIGMALFTWRRNQRFTEIRGSIHRG